MRYTTKQRRDIRKGLLDAVKQANNYKGKKYETVRISFPSMRRKPCIVTAKENKERHDEGLYRNALITVWETPVDKIYNNITYLKDEFKGDKKVQLALNEIEKFFRRKY